MTSPASARTFPASPCRSMASRSSISTTPPRRRSHRRCSIGSTTPTPPNAPTCIGDCITSPMPRPRPTRTRARRCAFLNAARKEEIIFTRNATEAINLVAYTYGRERIKAGDEIVLSIMEHHSNVVPWHFLRERQGAVIKWAPVDDEGNFLIDEFEKLLSTRTKMVAVAHMSNMLGTLVPVKEVVRRAHARGIPVLLDGAQAAAHL